MSDIEPVFVTQAMKDREKARERGSSREHREILEIMSKNAARVVGGPGKKSMQTVVLDVDQLLDFSGLRVFVDMTEEYKALLRRFDRGEYSPEVPSPEDVNSRDSCSDIDVIMLALQAEGVRYEHLEPYFARSFWDSLSAEQLCSFVLTNSSKTITPCFEFLMSSTPINNVDDEVECAVYIFRRYVRFFARCRQFGLTPDVIVGLNSLQTDLMFVLLPHHPRGDHSEKAFLDKLAPFAGYVNVGAQTYDNEKGDFSLHFFALYMIGDKVVQTYAQGLARGYPGAFSDQINPIPIDLAMMRGGGGLLERFFQLDEKTVLEFMSTATTTQEQLTHWLGLADIKGVADDALPGSVQLKMG